MLNEPYSTLITALEMKNQWIWRVNKLITSDRSGHARLYLGQCTDNRPKHLGIKPLLCLTFGREDSFG